MIQNWYHLRKVCLQFLVSGDEFVSVIESSSICSPNSINIDNYSSIDHYATLVAGHKKEPLLLCIIAMRRMRQLFKNQDIPWWPYASEESISNVTTSSHEIITRPSAEISLTAWTISSDRRTLPMASYIVHPMLMSTILSHHSIGRAVTVSMPRSDSPTSCNSSPQRITCARRERVHKCVFTSRLWNKEDLDDPR